MNYPIVRAENDKVWTKYCGFLDLSLEEFMAIQQALLLQQLGEIAQSPLGKKLLGKKVSKNIQEFRDSVPLTRYENYLPDLEPGNEGSLPEKPCMWAHTSGASSGFKQVPYTEQFYNKMLDNLMAAFILSCSSRRGQSSILEGDRVLFNVAPSPYMSGILARGATERFNLTAVIQPDKHDNMDFKEKITTGFEVALLNGMDILIAMTSVLVKMGNDFKSHSRKNGKLTKYLLHPGVLYRYSRAWIQSKRENRRVLPKDLWPVKSIISWGIDTSIFREQVYQYWGKYPYEFHAFTEGGLVALQSWNHKSLTFIPHSNFFEFIPEAEWLKNKRDSSYQPRTVLLPEVKAGERYELVITSFYDMPFIRYRSGHLIRITALKDEEAKVRLPQMVFEARADDLMDIAGFTRISEKTVAQALVNSRLNIEEWSIKKEVKLGKPILHLYAELNGNHKAEEVAAVIHQELKKIDRFYSDLDTMMDIHPLEVSLLHPGTFNNYYAEKKRSGAELAERKPPRVNASQNTITELINLSSSAK